MASIFFRLRLVPEDEADDVRALLDEHHIPWYETSAGRWGASFPAIWLREDEDKPRAQQLLDEYQRQRTERMQSEKLQRIQNGEQETLLSRLWQRPVPMLLALAAIAVIVYFSTAPFLSLFK